MRILLLYNNECALELANMFSVIGHEVEICDKKIDIDYLNNNVFDLIISYTYRYIISKDIINTYRDKLINIHNSYLPFNKGTSPNLWSIVERTPKGVSIHYISEKIDMGDIIAQRLVSFDDNDTLLTSYYKLDAVAKELIIQLLPFFDKWKQMSKKSIGNGSYHNLYESKALLDSINNDYNIKIKDLELLVKNENFKLLKE